MGPSGIRRLSLRLGLEWELALPLSPAEQAARDQIETVVIVLGSYRNLTTMTAAFYALHPAAMALNHAWVRLATKPSLDFLSDPRSERLQRFVGAAVRLAQGGRAGEYGGSILRSHAFQRPALRQLYDRRFGAQLVKPHLRALFWKDSMQVLNHLWTRRVDLLALTDALPQLRFVLPVRHPVDCALSVLRSDLWTYLVDRSSKPALEMVLERLFDILLWFEQQRRRRPDKFLLFWEFDLNEDFLRRLCAFSRLRFDPQWADDVLSTLSVDPKPHANADQELLGRLIEGRLGSDPELAAKARNFLVAAPADAARADRSS
jgi:hypothetical protein